MSLGRKIGDIEYYGISIAFSLSVAAIFEFACQINLINVNLDYEISHPEINLDSHHFLFDH